jgi:hypothetical protein
MFRIYSITIIIVFILTACSNKEEKPYSDKQLSAVPPDTISITKDVTIGSPTINPGDTTGTDQYLIDKDKRIKNIENNVLVRMLPNSIPGTEKLPADVGSINEGNKDFAVVFGTYKYPDGQISIELTDYQALSNIPDKILTILKKMPPQGKDIIIGKIELDEYWGFNYYNERLKTGYIRLVVADRFYIQIIYEHVPQSYTDVVKVVGMMNIKGMMKYK